MKIQTDVPLAPYTTLGVGGPARFFCEARSQAEVVEAAELARGRALPLFVLGGGSNLLVSDAGFQGVVLKVAIEGVAITADDDGAALLDVGAGEDWDAVVRYAVDHGLSGIECLAGIPGDAGGTPVQNVGAYGQEVADTIVRVRAYDLVADADLELSREQCGFAYRHSIFNSTERGRYVVTGVVFSLRRGGAPALRYADLQKHFAASIAQGMQPGLREVYDAVRLIRSTKGMLAGQGGPNGHSAGSFFKNPVVETTAVSRVADALGLAQDDVPRWPAADGHIKLPAAWLVERAGFSRGYAMGQAGISTQHTLALVNRGGATAAEIVALREAVVRGVEDRFGIRLEQEPVLLGF